MFCDALHCEMPQMNRKLSGSGCCCFVCGGRWDNDNGRWGASNAFVTCPLELRKLVEPVSFRFNFKLICSAEGPPCPYQINLLQNESFFWF